MIALFSGSSEFLCSHSCFVDVVFVVEIEKGRGVIK